MVPGGHKPCDVGHVHHEIRPRLPGGVGKGREVDGAAVGRGPGQNQLGAALPGLPADVLIVNEAVFVHLVELHVEQLAAEIHRGAVGQVTAVVEAHGQNGVAGLQHAHIGGQVGGGAAVGLDIDVIVRLKDGLPLAAAVFLQLIHILAAAVEPAPVAGGTLGGIALGIFVGQAGAYGLHDIFAYEVFAGDQLHGAVLPGLLGGNDLKNSGFQRCSSSIGPTGGDASAACGSRPACVHI